MGLKELKSADRIIFLKLFIAEMIMSCGGEDLKKKIEVEKLRQKFLGIKQLQDNALPQAANTLVFGEPIYSKEKDMPSKREVEPTGFQKSITATPKDEKNLPKNPPIISRKPSEHQNNQRESAYGLKRPVHIPKFHNFNRYQEQATGQFPQEKVWHSQVMQSPPIVPRFREEEGSLQNFTPSVNSGKQGAGSKNSKTRIELQNQEDTNESSLMSGFGKILPLLQDVSIQAIECRGVGKNILVRRFNKIRVTRIQLAKQEIEDIIYDFSRKSRIPVIGGILKAAVGELVISAILSEQVGSRFVISKITQYSSLEEMGW